jgi:hypothetical protein
VADPALVSAAVEQVELRQLQIPTLQQRQELAAMVQQIAAAAAAEVVALKKMEREQILQHHRLPAMVAAA